jgi:hypothetical protein
MGNADDATAWTSEAAHRVTRLARIASEAIDASPEHGDDLRGILVVRDDHGFGATVWGYEEDDRAGSVYDLIRCSGNLFASIGIQMELIGEKDGEESRFGFTQPPLAGGGTGEKVTLILHTDPESERMSRITLAVKEAVSGTGNDWPAGSKVIIMISMGDGEDVLLYHGLDTHELAHALLRAFQKVIREEGGHIMLIPMSGHPN